jgi:hypothetical protein
VALVDLGLPGMSGIEGILAEDFQSYDSVAERVVMDIASRELSVTPGIKGHAVRMNVELPKTPQ